MDISVEEAERSSEDNQRTGTTAGNATTSDANEHRFQKAIASWRSIDLSSLVPQLDKTAADIVENQKDAVIQRKDLAQKTKDFRKLDETERLTEIRTLLKAYQQFVDLLTNHGKAANNAFLQLYSTVSDAPDPYPLLEASVESLLTSEETLPKLQAENEHLQKSTRDLTESLETTETRVQEEQYQRQQLQSSFDDKAKDIEASWKAVLDEKTDNWEAKEKSLQEKLDSQERLFNEVKASYEVNQRLGQSKGNDEPISASASAAELEIVSSDLERTAQRLAEVESRNEQLRVELAQVSSNAPTRNVEDDPSFSRIRTENAKLLRKLESASFEKDSSVRKLESRNRALERDMKSLQEERVDLRRKLSQWKDYPEIRRELEVFKTIELSLGDDEETGEGDEKSRMNGTIPSGKKDSLEQMLLARNKKLSNEMATLRVAHQELQRDLEQLQESTSVTNAELERAQNLNAQLENDLLTLQQEASNQFPSGAKSITSRYPTTGTFRTRRSSPTSSIISGFDTSSRSPFDSLGTGEPVGGGSGILPMVQAQRDRFKQKISQLEAELSKQYNTVSSLRQEVASLQKDNLNLYEKTRYVSSYQRSGPTTSSSSAYGGNHSSVNVIQGSSDTPSGLSLDRYRSAYEANLSPFAQFRGRESNRAYRRLSLPERAIYSITRFVLASRTSRNLFAAYCVALHLLVFVMLYWMHGVDVNRHASNLGDHAAGLSDAAVAAGAAGAFGAVVGENEGQQAHHGEWHEEVLDAGAGVG